jgi:hypothetical protein
VKLHNLIFAILIFFLTGCKDPNFKLEGERLYFNSHTDSLELRKGESISKIGLPKIDNFHFNSPIWSKNENRVYMKINENKNEDCQNQGIGIFSLSGEIIDAFYKDSCKIIDFMPSPNDSLMLIRRFNYSDWIKGQYKYSDRKLYNIDYLIYNMNTKLIIDNISFKSELFLQKFNESNWSPDSERVLISRKLNQSVDLKNEEWYSYNTRTKDTTFINNGYNFIWSPVDKNLLSFLNDNTIWFYYADSKTFSKFYQLPSEKKIKSFKWTPNGEELFVLYGKHMSLLKPLGDKISWAPYSLLININTKDIIQDSGHEFIDSWK